MSSATGSPAAAKQEWGMPGLVTGYDRQSGKIVIADKERVIVKHLSARGLIVGIIQADQSVSQERSELTACLGSLLRGSRRLNDLNEGSASLQLGLAIIVEAASPRCS